MTTEAHCPHGAHKPLSRQLCQVLMCALEGNIYMESRKMTLMNLFAGYEQRHR